jgi:regulator of protease activity HflC (stomatin/prohibitin superfamily)
MFSRTLKLIAVFAMAMSFAACTKVPAGNVGIKIYLYGSDTGVDMEVHQPGRVWAGLNEDVFIFPTFSQTHKYLAEDGQGMTFGTKEGLTVSADVGITYNIVEAKVPAIFQKYRKGVEEITTIILRNKINDALVKAASTRTIESVYGEGKAALLQEVENVVRAEVKDEGINIERIYWVSQLDLPKEVQGAITAKVGATQVAMQRQNQVETAKADADIVRAKANGDRDARIAQATGEAEAIKLVTTAEAEGIKARAAALATNVNLVELTKAEKWNGQLPTTMLPNSTIPFMEMGK